MLSSLAIIIICFGSVCFIVAMLPFITDQVIGATSDELSAVIRWYYWAQYVGIGFSSITVYSIINNYLENWYLYSTFIFAFPLAMIIVSDCLCQQWLDRTHKVTNPIKLIIQVLNYTRKHRYPERRSAFTYIDEEQPTRMDYGKEKFGGPFTEEEVEDVKTVLWLLPLIICLSFKITDLDLVPILKLFEGMDLLNEAIAKWLFPIVLIPLYQFLLYRCFHSFSSSMLQCIGVGLFMCTLGFVLLEALGVVGEMLSGNEHRYLSCARSSNATSPYNQLEWYWKLNPWILYSSGSTITAVLFIEIIIAQSPDKMKGFVMGVVVFSHGFFLLLVLALQRLLCVGT